MATSPRSRLDRSLRQVTDWATELSTQKLNRFTDYSEGKGSLGLANIDILDAGIREASRSLLAAQAGRGAQTNQHMAFGFARMVVADMTDIASMKGTSDTIISDLDDVTFSMLGILTTGRPDLVKPYYGVVLDGLNHGYGVQDGHNLPLGTTLRYAAFGLSIVSNWLGGEPIDLDKYALPRDPAWGPLVAHWREPDPQALLPILLDTCDMHVERIALTQRETDSGKFEFSSVFMAVHPTEILAVLRLRDMEKLYNPIIEHPLMQTPYAAITCLPGAVTERDQLLSRYLAAVQARDPKVLPHGVWAF